MPPTPPDAIRDDAPFLRIDGDRSGGLLLLCDHASARVPADLHDLGLPPAAFGRHIAYDIGAERVTRRLAALAGAPALLTRFSRLVIDPNRGEDDPTLVMKLYDGTIVPANRHAGAAETEERLARLYRPYHAALARLAARQDDTAIVAVHSFTPCLKGRAPRPWQVGILYSHLDARLSRPLIAGLAAQPGLCVGDNEPYSGHLPGDAIDRHALQTGRQNTLVEVRNDLIGDAAGQRLWAARLAPVLQAALQTAQTAAG